MIIVCGTKKGQVETIDETSPTLKRLQDLVGGYIEVTTLRGLKERGIIMVVNEEGMLKGLKPNENMFPFFYLGNVVFARSCGENILGLKDKQVEYVKAFINSLSNK